MSKKNVPNPSLNAVSPVSTQALENIGEEEIDRAYQYMIWHNHGKTISSGNGT